MAHPFFHQRTHSIQKIFHMLETSKDIQYIAIFYTKFTLTFTLEKFRYLVPALM